MNQEDSLDFLFNQKMNSNDIRVEKNQKQSMEPQFEFVKGSDFRKGYYDQNIVETVYVRFYQVALFNYYSQDQISNGVGNIQPNNKRCVRSFLLKGESSKGTCFYQYQVISIKDYKISEKKLNTFIDHLNGMVQSPTSKIKHKFYPVYNFDYVDPPSGSEINECVSDLLL
jgi:hypothetical protein